LVELGSKKFWVLTLVFSSLWLAAIVVPIVYATLFPAQDFIAIRKALQMRGAPPPLAAAAVDKTIAAAGRLRWAVQVTYYSKITMTIQLNAKHTSGRTLVGYLASFDNIHRPTLLVVQRNEEDGALTSYQIGEGEPASFATSLGLPSVLFAVSLWILRRKKHAPVEINIA
jgi:hypothetical protein